MYWNSIIKGLKIFDKISKSEKNYEGCKFGKQDCHLYPIDPKK